MNKDDKDNNPTDTNIKSEDDNEMDKTSTTVANADGYYGDEDSSNLDEDLDLDFLDAKEEK